MALLWRWMRLGEEAPDSSSGHAWPCAPRRIFAEDSITQVESSQSAGKQLTGSAPAVGLVGESPSETAVGDACSMDIMLSALSAFFIGEEGDIGGSRRDVERVRR